MKKINKLVNRCIKFIINYINLEVKIYLLNLIDELENKKNIIILNSNFLIKFWSLF